MDCTRRTCWLRSTQEMWSLHATQEMLSVASNIGEFIDISGDINKSRGITCAYEIRGRHGGISKFRWRLFCERICFLWFWMGRPSHVLRCFHWSILFFVHGVRGSCETDLHLTCLQTLLAIGSTLLDQFMCIFGFWKARRKEAWFY